MKRKYLLLLIIVASCKSNEPGRFTISGDLRNAPDQKIFLEQLFFNQESPAVLDSGNIRNGKFKLSGVSNEEGLFRLRLQSAESGFIFINDRPEIELDADIKRMSWEGSIFNTPANIQLKKFLKQTSDMINETQEAVSKRQALVQLPGNDSMIAVATRTLQQLDDKSKIFLTNFADTVSDPVLGMLSLGYARNLEKTAVIRLMSNLSKKFPNHLAVQAFVTQFNQSIAQAETQSQPSNKVGVMAPELTMNDTNNKSFSLSELKGKYVLVDFWASWCAPCRGENPNVVAAYNKYKEKNFTILGVSLDENKASWLQAIKTDSLTWKQISDLKGWNSAAVSLYEFDGIPYNVLIDPQGTIIATALRGEQLNSKLEEVLK